MSHFPHKKPDKETTMATRTPKHVDRIALPRVIADAASALFARYEHLGEPQRSLHWNAVMKAFNQLYDGVKMDLDIEAKQIVFPSRTRTGVAHRVTVDLDHGQHTCTCEAHAEQEQPCWHVAAANLALYILDSQRPEPAQAQAQAQEPEPQPHDMHASLVEELRQVREKERAMTGDNSIKLTAGQVRRAELRQLRLWIGAARSACRKKAQADVDELFAA
jgi:hypothetical protein